MLLRSFIAGLLLLPSFLSGQLIEKTTHEYARKAGQSLELDVYQLKPAANVEQARPLLVWVHGGGFAGGERDHPVEVQLMESFAQKGYVAVSISYRLLLKDVEGGFGCDYPSTDKIRVFREAGLDLWEAIGYLWKQRKKWHLNFDQLVVGGSSAGAEAVLNAVYARDWLFEGDDPYKSIQVAAAWSLAGAMINVNRIQAENAVPAILFHGTDDPLVPYATAPHHYCPTEAAGYLRLDGGKTIADRLHALGGSYLLYTFEEAEHEIATMRFDLLDSVFAFLEATLEKEYRVQQAITIPPSNN